MTMTAISTKQFFNGNASATAFSFNFKVRNATHIEVWFKNTSDVWDSAALVKDTDYTVVLNNDGTGTVTYPISGTALAVGEQLLIRMAAPYSQLVDLTNSGPYNPEEIERDGLDNSVRQSQQLDERAGRSLRQPLHETTLDMSIPNIAARAGKYQGYGATGLPVVLGGVGTEVLLTDLSADSGAGLIGYKQPETGAVSRTVAQHIAQYPTVLDFIPPAEHAAIADNTTTYDATADLLAALNSGVSMFLPDGTYLIDAIVTTVKCELYTHGRQAIIKMLTPSVAGATCIALNVADSIIRGVHFDADNTSRSCVALNADRCEAHITVEKVNADAGTPAFPSGVEVNSADDIRISVNGDTFINTGAANASLPRAITIQGTSDRWHVDFGKMKDGTAGLVVGSDVGKGTADFLQLEDMADNGVYELGSDGTVVATMEYRGDEEATVNLGNLTVGHIITRGDCTAVIGLDNAESTYFGLIEIDPDGANGPGSLIRTRSGNTNSGNCKIDGVKGRFTGSTLLQFTTGTVDNVSIQNVDLEWVYDAAVSGVTSSWGNFSGLKGYDFRNWNIRIIDKNNVLTTENFDMVGPTTNLVRNSVWDSIYVSIYDADEFTKSSASFRCFNLAQALVFTNNVVWAMNVGPYAREITLGQPNSTNVNPTVLGAGTFRLGEDLILRDATGDLRDAAGPSLRTRCTLPGTPGTWIDYGMPGSAITGAADDTTPSVLGARILDIPANTGATAITQLDDAVVAQIVTLRATSATNPPTIADSGNFNLSAAWAPGVGDNITLFAITATTWEELARSNN